MDTYISQNQNTLNFHKNYEIMPDILEIRCDTMKKLLNEINKCFFDFQKTPIIRKAIRVAEYTKYSVRVSYKYYSQYAMNSIITKLENFQTYMLNNNYTEAIKCINVIMVEKNNYF